MSESDRVLSGELPWSLYRGSCLDLLRLLPDNCADACVTDGPYELGFMGSKWDGTGIVYSVELWREMLRVLKPGAHLLSFGGTRTYHRMACAIEDAGFDVRDSIHWIYGSGFPHYLNVSKAIDKADGLLDRRVVTSTYTASGNAGTSTKDKGGTFAVGAENSAQIELKRTIGATDKSRAWDGWATALRPSHEPIVVARKPFPGTVVDNILANGVGAFNIDACRVPRNASAERGESWARSGNTAQPDADKIAAPPGNGINSHPLGGWPGNVLLSHPARVWYALREDLNNDARDAVLDFYGARESVRALREDVSRDAVGDCKAEVLLKGMRWRVTRRCQEKGMGDPELCCLRERISGDSGVGQEREKEVLFKEVPRSGSPRKATKARNSTHGQVSSVDERPHTEPKNGELFPMEGRKIPGRGRLRHGHGGHAAVGSADHSETNANEAESVLHPGAQNSGRDDSREATGEVRGSAPPEWNQERQLTREPGSGTAIGPLDPSSASGDKVSNIGEGECEPTCRIVRFEVEADAIPENWIEYFEWTEVEQLCTETECTPDCPCHVMGEMSGETESSSNIRNSGDPVNLKMTSAHVTSGHSDSGTAARYFNQSRWTEQDDPFWPGFYYCSKAGTAERELGCEKLPKRSAAKLTESQEGAARLNCPSTGAGRTSEGRANFHPTVKPLELMRWLCRLVTPKNGLIIEPFGGSGSGIMAPILEGFRCIASELTEDYWPIIEARVAWAERERFRATRQLTLFGDP